MAEVRVVSVLILLVLVGIVGFLVLTFGGWMAIGWFNKKTADDLVAGAKGYTAAKTPAEALDKFREAIQNREYKVAGEKYCTKAYADVLARAHTNAADLGGDLDKIREFGKNKSIMTDKATFLLHTLDPYPKNFKVGPAPKVDKDDKKAVGTLIWEPLAYKDIAFKLDKSDMNDLDVNMFQNALVGAPTFAGTVMTIPLVKEGEEWKLDLPMTPAWEATVKYFIDRSNTYHTGLTALIGDQTREKYESPRGYEGDILAKLRAAKN